MRSSPLVRLYPPSWQRRYGEEMRAIVDDRPLSRADLLDLARGALDAWLHPATPSRVPAVAALIGGGIWTVVAAAVVFQPTPPDWPGYLAEMLGLAVVAVAALLVATLGCALRLGDTGGRMLGLAAGVTIAGYLAWLAAIAAAGAGIADGPTLATAQTLAMMGSAAVGISLVRAGDEGIGLVILVASVGMLVPWAPTWLMFGGAWTAIGMALLVEGPRQATSRWDTTEL
jgi:hypothetical protein